MGRTKIWKIRVLVKNSQRVKHWHLQDVYIKYLHLESHGHAIFLLCLLICGCQMIRLSSPRISARITRSWKTTKNQLANWLWCVPSLQMTLDFPPRRYGISEHFKWNMHTKDSHFLRRKKEEYSVFKPILWGWSLQCINSQKMLPHIIWWSTHMKKNAIFLCVHCDSISSSDTRS